MILREQQSLLSAMVAQYGMSDTLGPIAYSTDDSNVFLGKELGHSKNYSESTAAKIDKEVSEYYHNWL